MDKKSFIKIISIIVFIIVNIFIIPKIEFASEDKQTWRVNPDCKIQEIPVESINGVYYSRNYSWGFANTVNSGWSGKTIYGGSIQGSTVTERHIIFAVIRGSSAPTGYIYVANKTTGVIEQSIPVANAGSNSIYGHMNDMTYNPNTKEIFLPIPSASSDTGRVAIFKYNSNGSLNTTPTVVNQCDGYNCGNMAYNSSLDKYLFNAGVKIYIVSRDGQGFKTEPDKIVDFNWGDFRYMTPQSIETSGKYFYKIFSEDGVSTSRDYHDSKELGSCIAAAYEIETGKLAKGIFISNKSVSGELEGISFDPVDGSMILAYNVNLIASEQRYDNTAFYKLKSGNQILDKKEQYFYNNGFVAPKATITAENYGVNENLIRFYNGNNNFGDGHSNSTDTWYDLSGKFNGSIEGEAEFKNEGYLNLNGKNNWVNIGNIPDAIYNNVTMEIEVAFSEISEGEVDLLSNMESGGYALLMLDGKPSFQVHINGKIESVVFDEELLSNRLYNITGVFDGENLLLYIDGALRATKNIGNKTTVKAPSNNTVMAIGTNPNGNNAAGCFMKGAVYSVRIYQSVLKKDEIKKNMNADRITYNTIFSDSSDKVGITINFSEPVADFSIDDITVNNAKKGTLKKNTDKKYEIEITNIKENANLEISIDNGSFTDLTGNAGIGSTIKRYRDAAGPTATIIANKEDIIKEKNIIYTISFNEKVTGFDINDIIIKNGIKNNFEEIEERKVYNLSVSKNNEEGQEITIPEGVVYDSSGNGNLIIKKQFKTEDESLEVKVEVNEVVEENGTKYIENINPNTTIESLKKNIKTNGEIEIYKESSKIIDEKQLIGTGMKVVIKLKEEEKRYITIVTGDLIGNGEMGIIDLLKLSRYIANLDKTLNKEYLKASDIVKDRIYGSILDILKMARILSGLEQL